MALSAGQAAWQLRLGLRRLGWPGALGLTLAGCAVVFWLAAVPPLHAELESLRLDAEGLHARHRTSLEQPAAAPRGPAQQLDTFYEFFPPVGTLPQWLTLIYEAAEKQGLALEAGNYALVQQNGQRLARYQITLPVRASYEQIRRFMAAVLNQVPAAAFEDIGLQRETIGSAALEGRIRLTLFVRMENW